MGDFLAFNAAADKKTNGSSGQKPNQSTPKSCAKANVKLSGMPAFGSPAINYGGSQVQFGSPAITNTNTNANNVQFSPSSAKLQSQPYTPRGMNSNNNRSPRAQFNNSFSPRSQNGFSPRSQSFSPRNQSMWSPRHQGSYSPRHQGSYSPRHQTSFQYTPSPCNVRKDSNDSFKTPMQYSPGQGRGGGRKAIFRQYDKTPRFDPNSNAGGSTNIEDYYNPSMLRDPWSNLCPVLAKAR